MALRRDVIKFKITVIEDDEGEKQTQTFFDYYETAVDAVLEAQEMFPHAVKVDVTPVKEQE